MIGNPLSQYLMIGKLVAILMLLGLVSYQSSQIHRWHKQADGLSQKLEQITTAKNQQGQVTKERAKVVTKLVHDADDRAKVVEQAPPAKDCKTKPEVLQADL